MGERIESKKTQVYTIDIMLEKAKPFAQWQYRH
jgi:hypothetical protein